MEEDTAIEALAALAQPTRLRAFRMLVGAGLNGIAAGEIARAEGVPHNTMSNHLALLARAGLVRSRKDGRSVIYAADLDGTRALLSFLVSDCCSEHPEICAPLLEIAELAACKHPRAAPLSLPMSDRAYNVLFLCTGNSSRSIMAEAILNEIGHGRFFAYSAGSRPEARPTPEVIERLRSLGHNVAGLRSKSWTEFLAKDAPRMDFVIVLCDILDEGVCPEFGPAAVSASWPVPAPGKFSGVSPAERTTLLNELYSSLRRRIEIFTGLPFATLDRKALHARLAEIGAGRIAALEGAY
jgi:arsenate reductase